MSSLPRPLKWYKELAEKKARLGAGVFLVEGEKTIRQIRGGHPEAIKEILFAGELPADFRQFPLRRVTAAQFDYFSTANTPQGIAAVVKLPADVYSAIVPADAGDKILLLEDIQDPGNVGTLIRTAAAFDFSGVILTDKCADPFSPKVVQASAGAVLSLWLRVTAQYLDLVKTLKQKGYPLLAAELDARDGPEVLHKSKFILALGNEAAGITRGLQEIADYHVAIPIKREKAESLNASVCGGILMYLSAEKI